VRLEQLGIPVYSGRSTFPLIGVIESMKRLAESIGSRGPAGVELEQKLREPAYCNSSKAQGRFRRKRVFFVVWTAPLQSIGKEDILSPTC